MFEPALDRDGIEALSQVLCLADTLHLVAPPNVFLDHVGCCKDAMARLPKKLGERRVIQLTDDLRFYVLESNHCSDVRRSTELPPGRRKGHAVERLREASPAGFGKLRCGEQCRTALTEQMVERSDRSARRRWGVRKHDIDCLHGQLTQECLGGVGLSTDDPDVFSLRRNAGSSIRYTMDVDRTCAIPITRRIGRPVSRPLTVARNSRPREKISSA